MGNHAGGAASEYAAHTDMPLQDQEQVKMIIDAG